jgi:two-component system, NarL family, sensor histidine kinase DevS
LGDLVAFWRSPAGRLVAVFAFALAAAAVLVLIAAGLPRHGLAFRAAGDRVEVAAASGGPWREATAVIASNGARVPLEPALLTPEPDVLPSYAEAAALFARQDVAARALSAGGARLQLGRGEAALRPGGGLPVPFWFQLGVGLVGFAISGWVWSTGPGRLPNGLFFLSGLGMLAFTGAAAVYTTRELTMPGRLFEALNDLNHAGAMVFGAAMTALFLVYPRRLVPGRALVPLFAVFAAWLAADVLRLVPSVQLGASLAVTVQMLLIAVAVAWQFVATRGDPVGRAALRWVGVATLFGAGLFIATAIVPSLFGAPPIVDQGYAFAFFLLIHAGVAIGLRRERLFAMDGWAVQLLFYGAVSIVFLATDLLLVVLLGSIPKAGALTCLLLLPLLYLPLRDRLTGRLSGRTDLATVLEQVARVPLAVDPAERASLWTQVLQRAFAPLEIGRSARAPTVPVVEEDGRALVVPAVAGAPALRLGLARRGGALFKPVDRSLAARMVDLARQVDIDREAYARGISAERSRVSRDLHDDLAARLMSGLVLDDPQRLRETIRAALAEVRGIVSAARAAAAPLADCLADARAEADERVEAAGILLTWPLLDDGGEMVEAEVAKALSSALRELVTNVLRHSAARHVRVAVAAGEKTVSITMENDGVEDAGAIAGNGLRNIAYRLRVAGGDARFDGGDGRFKARLTAPLIGAGMAHPASAWPVPADGVARS